MEKIKLVSFAKIELKKAFLELKEGKFEEKNLYNFINRAIGDLKENPFSGVKIPKKLWPKKYIKEYKITNLWKYNLPNAWRLVYTLIGDEVKIVSMILEWGNHKDYERRFSY
jgi:Txe/YoeB family toxin of Txe-Axe toxin-antitoxin module